MDKVKIDKDIYVRDEYGVRVRMFVAGQEVDRFRYDEAFRLNVPVNPEDLPVEPEFRGTESLNGRILEGNKELFVEKEQEPEDEPLVKEEEKSAGQKVVEAIREAEAEKETEEAEEVSQVKKTKKKGK